MDKNTTDIETARLEYISLRDELSTRLDHRFQILGLILTFAGIFSSFGLHDPKITLVYPPLVAFLAIAWYQNDIRARNIAEYIRKHFEDDEKGLLSVLNWETYSEKRRTNRKQKWYLRRITPLSYIGLIIATQIIALIIGRSEMSLQNPLTYISIGSVGISLLVMSITLSPTQVDIETIDE